MGQEINEIPLVGFFRGDFLDGEIAKIDGVSMRLQENRGLFCFPIVFYFLELTLSLGFIPLRGTDFKGQNTFVVQPMFYVIADDENLPTTKFS